MLSAMRFVCTYCGVHADLDHCCSGSFVPSVRPADAVRVEHDPWSIQMAAKWKASEIREKKAGAAIRRMQNGRFCGRCTKKLKAGHTCNCEPDEPALIVIRSYR